MKGVINIQDPSTSRSNNQPISPPHPCAQHGSYWKSWNKANFLLTNTADIARLIRMSLISDFANLNHVPGKCQNFIRTEKKKKKKRTVFVPDRRKMQRTTRNIKWNVELNLTAFKPTEQHLVQIMVLSGKQIWFIQWHAKAKDEFMVSVASHDISIYTWRCDKKVEITPLNLYWKNHIKVVLIKFMKRQWWRRHQKNSQNYSLRIHLI